MKVNTITYHTTVKVGNHKIFIRDFIDGDGWLIVNKKGTWIGSITKSFGFDFNSYNEIGDKLAEILLKRYPSGNAAQQFICEFCAN